MKRSEMVTLEPGVLRWARERAGLDVILLAHKLGVKAAKEVEEWEETGTLRVKQVDKLAHATHTPVGYLYLREPPKDELPIPDFRTGRDTKLGTPSPDLLETVQTMLRRQAWMRDQLIEEGHAPLPFVGSAALRSAVDQVASNIRRTLGLADGWAERESSWKEALKRLRSVIEEAGVLIVINGVVGNSTRRKLNPDEFRGFALSDPYAPLIFVNNADYKAAQMFTIAHELAHLWLGEGGVSGFEALEPPPIPVEQFCNKVAAEFLIPEGELRRAWEEGALRDDVFDFIARRFRVSTVVAARRAFDAGFISHDEFLSFYQGWEVDTRRNTTKSKGGDFWNTQNVRIGHRFGKAVVRAAKEGRLLYSEAYRLTGLRGATFDHFAKSLGYGTT
jgi:Zn-dependent peptidase ImmA (M78 family)